MIFTIIITTKKNREPEKIEKICSKNIITYEKK